MWVFKEENKFYKVGYWKFDVFVTEFPFKKLIDALRMVHYLNGGNWEYPVDYEE